MSDKIFCKDLYLSAYLKSSGISLESVAKQGKHSIFYFKESEKARKLISRYIQDKATINVKLFRNSLRDLKSLVCGDIPILKDDKEE
ncbi:MAG: hypothetical protein HQ555_07735 [Candidatus Aminicenantes bacterium]|nr:hypothetical protein [Candidatus Aminicenantes bacterium]